MQSERRKHERYPLEFQLDIRGDNQTGKSFQETAQLLDISGGGALFRSSQVDSYYEGQLLQTDVILPGTPHIRGQMHTQATVTRLQQDKYHRFHVSIQFLHPFKLLRKDVQR